MLQDFAAFNNLDNTVLDHLLSFADAPFALRLAKTSRRLYDVYQRSTNLRPFRHISFISVNLPWKLGDLLLNMQPVDHDQTEQVKSVEVKGIELTLAKTPSQQVKHSRVDPDLVIVEGRIVIQVFHGSNLAEWKCTVDGSSVLKGFRVLLQLFIKRLQLKHLTLFYRNRKTLDVRPFTDSDIIAITKLLPNLSGLLTDTARCGPFGDCFFTDKTIRGLDFFCSAAAACGLNDENILKVRWKRFTSHHCEWALTLEGVQSFLKEWKEDRKEIEKWHFSIPLGVASFQEAAEYLLETVPLTNRATEIEVLTRSKSGREMIVKLNKSEKPELRIEFGLRL